MLTIDEALSAISTRVAPLPPLERHLHDAQNLLLAKEVVSPLNSPPFDKACMDGYAVRSADFAGTVPTLNLIGELTAGQVSSQSVAAGQALRIMTGAPLPEGADTVIQHELTTFLEESQQVLFKQEKVSPGLNVLRCGEIMQSGETVFAPLTRLRPQELALLAEMGFAKVLTYRPPRIAVLATGDELVAIEEKPGPGQIRNTNEVMLVEQIRQAGAVPVPLGIARDNRADLTEKVKTGLQHDMLILSGGVSAGQLDLVPGVLEGLEVTRIFHKVKMKPGKPVWFGAQATTPEHPARYVFGLPGNPVSSMVCFEVFVKTAIRRLQGFEAITSLPERTSAVLVDDFYHKGPRPTFWPVQFGIEQGEARVRPLEWRGSADLKGITNATGMALFSKPDFTYKSGERIDFYAWS